MLNRDGVLAVLKQRGPSLPIHIKKAIGKGDTFMIGAILTELRSSKLIKVSNTKRGGSPFYYVPEHTYRLDQLIPDLGEKDRRTALLLKERKVLRDKDQDPLVRVSLRQIKDFAVPVEVKLSSGSEQFWKWFATPNDEIETIIKTMLGFKKSGGSNDSERKKAPLSGAVKKQSVNEHAENARKEYRSDSARETKREALEEKTSSEGVQKKLSAAELGQPTNDAFLLKIRTFCKDKKIVILQEDVIRKNSDIELLLEVPTPVGNLEFFCKAKSKKNCNDGDLSTAYLKGQNKKLPTLFVTTGNVSKKAMNLLNEFKGLIVKKI